MLHLNIFTDICSTIDELSILIYEFKIFKIDDIFLVKTGILVLHVCPKFFHVSAFLIQFFLRWQKIADMNSEILSSCRQISKSCWQIYFLLLAHYQLTTLLRQAGNLLLESFGILIFIMKT